MNLNIDIMTTEMRASSINSFIYSVKHLRTIDNRRDNYTLLIELNLMPRIAAVCAAEFNIQYPANGQVNESA